MFWYDLMKKKKSKYKIMNKVSKLVDEHNKLNAKESCNRRNELREKVKSLYEQMDDIESSSDFSTFSDILLKINAEYEEVKKDAKEVKALKDYMDNLVSTTEERWSNMIQLKNSQADYDQLSNEQKMNGTLYFVKG